MTRIGLFQTGTFALLAISVGIAPAVFAGDVQAPPNFAQAGTAVDVSLGDNGVLLGQVLDAKRLPAAGQPVRVRFQGEVVATALTDQDGRFSVRGLRAGSHVVESATGSQMVRLWSANTAPPSAQPGALVQSGQGSVVRGNIGNMIDQKPVLAGAIGGGIVAALTYWALDYNPDGS